MSDIEIEEIVKRRAALVHEIMALKGKSGGMKMLNILIGLPDEQLIKIRDELKKLEEQDDT